MCGAVGALAEEMVTSQPVLVKYLMRSLPEMWASTMWPLSSWTRNIVPGRTVTILPSTSIALPSDMVVGGDE